MIADELSRIAMSANLGASLARAVEYARAQGHFEVTLEHMLLALCEDPDAALVLAASNVDTAQLTAEASGYIGSLQRQGQPGRPADPSVSLDLRRILEAAAAAARGGRRREINGAIVLAAIVGDGKSTAAQLLHTQGLTFDGAIRALQRAPAAPSRPNAGANTEQLLASARERVQARSIHSVRKPEPFVPRQETPAAPPEPAPAPAPKPAFHPPAVERAALAVPAPRDITSEKPPARLEVAPMVPAAPEPAGRAPEAEGELEPAEARNSLVAKRGNAHAEEAPPEMVPPREPPIKLSTRLESVQLPRKAPSAPPAERAPFSETPPMSSPTMTPPPIPPQIPGQAWGAPIPGPPPGPSLPDRAPPSADRALPSPDRSLPPPQASGLPMRAGPPPVPPPLPPQARAAASEGPPPSGAPRPGPPPVEQRRPGAPPLEAGGAGNQLGTLAAKRRAAPALAAGAAPQVGRPVQGPRADIGQLVENIPRTMRVAVPSLIEVRVAKAEVQALAHGLQGGGAAYQHEVTVTKAMSVRLRAPDGGFYIETASPETQWIEKSMMVAGEDFASWRWHVTPREKGKKRLQLIISARTVGGDGLAAETALPDQVITVKVRTNYGQVLGHWAGWGVAAVLGGLLARFGDGAFSAGQQIIGKLMAGG